MKSMVTVHKWLGRYYFRFAVMFLISAFSFTSLANDYKFDRIVQLLNKKDVNLNQMAKQNYSVVSELNENRHQSIRKSALNGKVIDEDPLITYTDIPDYLDLRDGAAARKRVKSFVTDMKSLENVSADVDVLYSAQRWENKGIDVPSVGDYITNPTRPISTTDRFDMASAILGGKINGAEKYGNNVILYEFSDFHSSIPIADISTVPYESEWLFPHGKIFKVAGVDNISTQRGRFYRVRVKQVSSIPKLTDMRTLDYKGTEIVDVLKHNETYSEELHINLGEVENNSCFARAGCGLSHVSNEFDVEEVLNVGGKYEDWDVEALKAISESNLNLKKSNSAVLGAISDDLVVAEEGLLSAFFVETIVFPIVGSIGGIYEVFNSTGSSDLDKASVSLSWVPIIGEILGFIDAEESRKRAKRKLIKINQEAEELHNEMSYEFNQSEHNSISKVLSSAEEMYDISNYAKELEIVYDKSHLQYQERVSNELDLALDSFEVIAQSQLPETISEYLEEYKLLINYMILARYSSPMDEKYNSFLNQLDFFFVDDQINDCRNGFLTESNITKCLATINKNVLKNIEERLMDDDFKENYKKSRDALILNNKLNFLSVIHESLSEYNKSVRDKFKYNTNNLKSRMLSTLSGISKNSFNSIHNLNSKGQKLDNVCWKTERYNCISAVQNCKNKYPGAQCYHLANAPDVCQQRRVYTCPIFTYDAIKDKDYQNAIARVNNLSYAAFDTLDIKFDNIIRNLDTSTWDKAYSHSGKADAVQSLLKRALAFKFNEVIADITMLDQNDYYVIRKVPNNKDEVSQCLSFSNGMITFTRCEKESKEQLFRTDINTIRPYLHSNVCLDIEYGYIAKGSRVIPYTCKGSVNQLWELSGDAIFALEGRELCLGEYAGGAELVTCGGSSSKVRIEDGFDTVTIISLNQETENYSYRNSGKSVFFYTDVDNITVTKADASSRARSVWSGKNSFSSISIMLNDSKGNSYPAELTAQKVGLYGRLYKMNDGAYNGYGSLKVTLDRSKNQHLPKNTKLYNKEAITIYAMSWSGSPIPVNKMHLFIEVELGRLDGYQQIKKSRTDRCLYHNEYRGTIALQDCNVNASTQKFRYNSQQKTIETSSGHCLDLKGGNNQLYQPIIPYQCHGGLNQSWERDGSTSSGFRLKSLVPGIKRCLDFDDYYDVPAFLFNCDTSSDNQRFFFF